MPAHKNQHYVPRCYLRSFSVDDRGKAVNLHNIGRARSVCRAPLKNQCSSPYIYGKDDLELERSLGKLENAYAAALRKVRLQGQRATADDIACLLGFMTLQYARTEAAMERIRSAVTGVEEAVRASTSARLPEIDTDSRAMMIKSLSIYTGAAHKMKDLKSCLVRNKSRTDFITSDDPVCFTSRFHANRGMSSFGIASTGALFFMPLSPKLLLLCYDAGVYSIRRFGLYVETKLDRDVEACNELQYLNAHENVYFTDWTRRDQVEAKSAAVKGRRPSFPWHIARFTEDGWVSPSTQRYRPMAAGERMEHDSMMLGMSRVQVLPKAWSSIVRFRRKIKYVEVAPGQYRRPGTAHSRRGHGA